MQRTIGLICLIFLTACTEIPTPAAASTANPMQPSIVPTDTLMPAPTLTQTVTPTGTSAITPIPNLTRTADWAEFQVTMSALKTQVVKIASPASSPTPSPTAVPSIRFSTSNKNKVLLIYGNNGRTEESLFFLERGPFFLIPHILLYADGHLIFRDKKGHLWETYLAKDEINVILSKLETLGFFNLANDSYLYENIPANAFDICCYSITIEAAGTKKNRIDADSDFHDYYVQPLKEIIAYLDSLSFSGLKSYQPDELMVGIREGNGVPGPPQPAIPWPNGVTAPDQRAWDGVLVLKRAEAKLMLSATSGKMYYSLFFYKGKEYTAIMRPIYPHECLVRHYDDGVDPSKANASFLCEDWY